MLDHVGSCWHVHGYCVKHESTHTNTEDLLVHPVLSRPVGSSSRSRHLQSSAVRWRARWRVRRRIAPRESSTVQVSKWTTMTMVDSPLGISFKPFGEGNDWSRVARQLWLDVP